MKNLRVLYVEDEPDIRTLTEIALEEEGFDLVVCGSGQEALVKGATENFDLLLIDVMMPGLDGPSTLKALRTRPHLASVPAIFMTAKVQPPEIQEYYAMGALGVIPKPFDTMNLGNEIRGFLEQEGQGG